MPAIRASFLMAATFATVCASAHHSATGRYELDVFDMIEGEVTDIFWRNPHVRFLIRRSGDDGQEEEWEVEFGSVNTVERLGVSGELVAVGDRVGVYGRMGRNGLTAMFASRIIMPDGEEVVLQADPARRYGITEDALRDADAADPSARADIFRIWVPITYPSTSGGAPDYPLTEAGRAAQTRWDPDDDPALRCIPPGMPAAMGNPYPIAFENRGEMIVLRLEEWDGQREIYMSGEGEPSQPRMGRSVGRWEGRTLVVDTRDIDWRYVDDLGAPQSEGAVINERFTLSEDGTDLFWIGRITDSVNYTEPVLMEAHWTWIPGHEIKPFDCEVPPDRR